MINKFVRLTKALRNESAKRVPYILVILVILILWQGLRLDNKTEENTRIAKDNTDNTKALLLKVAELSEDNKILSEQNKVLTQQGISIANQNTAHIDCVAELFARYTRDLRPVSSVDLNTCTIQTTAQTTATTSVGSAQPLLSGQSGSSSSSQSNTPSTPPQSNNPQPPVNNPPPPTPEQGLVSDLLDGTLNLIRSIL